MDDRAAGTDGIPVTERGYPMTHHTLSWAVTPWLGLAFPLALALLMAGAPGVRAGGVVGTGSPASCTEAALDAALGGGGVVTFNCGAGPATIVLTGQKNVTQTTTIEGAGKITLRGSGTVRLFNVSVGAGLNLRDLTLSNGTANQGGAIYNDGTVTIDGSWLDGNNAPGGVAGGIFNNGTLSITNSTLSNNVAAAGLAGGIQNNGVLTVGNSTFSGNYGSLAGGGLINGGSATISGSTFDGNGGYHSGGIQNNGSLVVSDSTFTANTANGGLGGGLYNGFGFTATVTNSTFISNSTSGSGYGAGIYNGGSLTVAGGTLISNTSGAEGGGIYNEGSLTISASRLSVNGAGANRKGGGIYNSSSGVLSVFASTISVNTAPGGLGGGIYNAGRLTVDASTLSANAAGAGLGGGIFDDITGTLTITNSTFSGNFGGFGGGGISASGPVTVTNSTFYSNTASGGSGLSNGGLRPFVVKNTIVANNACGGPITSLGHNLESGNTCGFTAAGDLVNTNPLLGPLAANGGQTQTDALLPGSPAINAGDDSGCPATDQRGFVRVGRCDIGAYEFVLRTFLPLIVR